MKKTTKKLPRVDTDKLRNRFIIQSAVLSYGLTYVIYATTECSGWSMEQHIDSVGTGFNN